MKNVSLLLILVSAVLLPSGMSRAGVVYPDPPGGWLYTYTGNAASDGTGGYTALDGTWSHDNGSDEWDGTIIGAGRPGGAFAFSDGATNLLRLQDTGDPCDYGMYDPGSNRKIMFGHSITSDIGASGDKILDDGITISFRARISTTPPLDDLHEDGGGAITPWPAGGDGYVLHHGGKSNFSVRQSNGNGIISFALVLQGEDHSAVAIPYSGLVMNDLNGTLPTSDVDQQDNDGGTLNLLSLNPTNWHEFWITIESDPGMTGTHVVNIYMDGSLTPAGFNVTAGNGADYIDSYIAMGVGSTAQSGALDIDFFSYKPGVHPPIDLKVPKHLKWSQPPIEIEPLSEPLIYCGWDEPSLREWAEPIWFDCWNCPTQCNGDADCDRFAGPLDMAILNMAFGTAHPEPAYNPCADFDRNLVVDTADLIILQLNWETNPDSNCEQRPQSWKIVADDFRCLGTMPVTSVHWWGSYLNWDGPEPPFIVPEAWRIGFWSNVPEPVWSSGKLVHDPEGIGPAGGGWGVLEVVNNGIMNNVGDAVKSLESGTGDRLSYTLLGPLNINDHEGNAANFGADVGYGVAYENLAVGLPWPAPGSVEDIALLARGRVHIPTTGDWTFYIRSDDGEELSIDYGALVIGSEGWYDNNFGTINLTAGEHDIQVIHREQTGGANVEVAAAKGATNNLYFFRLIGSGDPGLPATISIVPGLNFDPLFTQSKPGESGTLNNLAQAQVAISMSLGMTTAVRITYDRVNHSDPDNRGLGNDVFPSDHDNPWDLFWGAGNDDDDSAILVEGEILIQTGGTYYIGYNSDDGAQLRIDTGGLYPWLSIFEDATGSAVLTTTIWPNDTLQTDVKTGKSWTVGEIFLLPGGYPFELLMFERGGGFFVEMFGGTIPGVYDLLLTGPERPVPVPEVAPALDLVRGQTPIERDYSYPGELIWDIEIPADRVEQEFVGYDEFPDKPFDSCFQYYVDLQPDEWFLQDPYTDIHFPGPVAYYKLNGDANDSSGNGHDGTEYGGPTYVPGVIGQAIDLDGIDDYVDTGYTTNLQKWTIAAWVTSPAAPAAAAPSGPVHREKNYQINWNHVDPVFRGAAGLEVGGTWYPASFGTLNANTWYHLSATYDGDVLKAYKNGDLITSNPAPSGNPSAEAASLKLGKHALSPQFFAGSIDDVRIYDQALSKEQIKTQMIGLVAHYKLDEASGLTAADSSCHGNHGTLSDGPTWQPAGGYVVGALLFDGIDDRVECGSLGISGNASRTIGGWAKASTTAIPNWTTVFGFSNAGNVADTYFDIEKDNLGNYVLHTCYWEQVLCPVDLNWHHFAATHDGTTTAWYLDGVLLSSAPKTLSTVDEVRMGMRKWNGNHFPGLIDDVAIFNSALSSSEIFQLMNFAGGSFIGDPSLVALWELDESSGYTASDSSGNGNHGTLNDPPIWRPMGGQIKGALDFDGKDDSVDNGKTASQLGIGGNNPRTITAWVFTRSFMGGGIYEMGQDGSGADGRDFSLRAKWVDNNWRVQYWGAAYDADFTYTSKNKWVHFAHVHDGSYSRVYADGQEVVNISRILNTTNNKTFRLGRWQNNYFDGLIDDVRIYNRALGTDEIKSLTGSGEDIFWLSVAAVYPDDVNIYNPWGFKTRPESWMDDAVRFEILEEPYVGTVIDPCIVTPIEDPRTQESFDLAFELDTDPDYIKWEQPFTGIRRWPHYEDELSRAIADPVQDLLQIERLVADDWRCDRETPVTAAVWWGSYIGYEYYACQEQQFPAPVKPDYFWLTIWTDVPAGEDPDPQVPFSHPGKKIWEYSAYDYDEVLVGYDKHPHVGMPGALTSMQCTEKDPAAIAQIRQQAMLEVVDVPDGLQMSNEGCEELVVFKGHDLTTTATAESGTCSSILYAPSQMDDAAYRTAISAACGGATVDYYDARAGTPSVALLSTYDCVYTQVDYPYADNVLFGDNLANYVDAGGTVILGVFCTYTQGNYLSGRIMTPTYCPVTSPNGDNHYVTSNYAGDGMTCIHNGITNYACNFRDYLQLQGSGMQDGSYQDGEIAHAYRPDFKVIYSNGHGAVGGGGTGQWPQLIANACSCSAVAPREPVFRYSVRLPKHAWFLQEDVNNIYWFSVVAVYNAGSDPLYQWGWTNHPHFFNDDAVAGWFDTGVGEWVWEELYDQTEESQDMSFMLFTEPDCLKRTAFDYSAWAAYSKPKCWCYHKQCRGDADGLLAFGRPVALSDLNILKAGFGKTVPDLLTIPNGFCGDFDHVTAFARPVALSDLNILKLYFGIIDAAVPKCDQAPIYTGGYNYWTEP